MEEQQRKRYTSEEKVAILKEHLTGKKPVSEVCERHGIAVNIVVGVKSFDDVQRALKDNKCIKEIHFFVHAGPGILFLDMNSVQAESNISKKGGKHIVKDGVSSPIEFNSRGVSELDVTSTKKYKWWQFGKGNSIFVHGCNSEEIAQRLGEHFNASGHGIKRTCYYPVVKGNPVPASGSYYYWLVLTGQTKPLGQGWWWESVMRQFGY